MTTPKRGKRNVATSEPMKHTPRSHDDIPPPKVARRKTAAAVAASAPAAAAADPCHIVIRKLSAGGIIVEEYDGVYNPEQIKKHGVGQYQIALVRSTGTETIVQVVKE